MRLLLPLFLLCFGADCLAVTEPKVPQRIVALAPHITEMLYAVGAGQQVIAVSDFSDYPAQAQVLPRVANFAGVNVEAILALQPDLIIAWRSGTPVADVNRLKQLGLRVAFSDPVTLNDISTELRMLGELSGHPQQGAKQSADFAAALLQLSQQYQYKKPVKVFFAMGVAPLSTVANRAWPQQMLQLCQADNSFATVKGDYPQVGIEQVLQAQPEVIIQASRAGAAADFSYWHRYTSLPAVKQQQFITLNADHLYRTTRRTLLGISQLCQALDAYR
ncbi:cobalamin-binding protein [Rheinheimera gaetbuli]